MNQRKSFLIVLAIALATTAAAQAEPRTSHDGEPQVVVPYGDLDLSASAGTKALHGRIGRAARMLCANDGHGRDLASQTAARSCMKFALEQASIQEARAIRQGAEGTSLALSRHR